MQIVIDDVNQTKLIEKSAVDAQSEWSSIPAQDEDAKKQYVADAYNKAMGKHIKLNCRAKKDSWNGQDRINVGQTGDVI